MQVLVIQLGTFIFTVTTNKNHMIIRITAFVDANIDL